MKKVLGRRVYEVIAAVKAAATAATQQQQQCQQKQQQDSLHGNHSDTWVICGKWLINEDSHEHLSWNCIPSIFKWFLLWVWYYNMFSRSDFCLKIPFYCWLNVHKTYLF